jgi:hypothetical protein
MTNKDNIQQKHLACKDGLDKYPMCKDTADQCTTVTAEAIGDAMEWVDDNYISYYLSGSKLWRSIDDKNKNVMHPDIYWYTTTNLVQLFLNQKAKI